MVWFGCRASHALQATADTLRGSHMRLIKTLLGTTALVVGLAIAPAAKAQVVVEVGVQPVCSYGYYGYAPYSCAPDGYYGPGYFYNGIFLGMGPWGGWGYSHGWGGHRFVSEGGGSYHGGPGRASYHENAGQARGGGQVRSNATVSHSNARPSAGGQVRGNAAVSHGGAIPSAGRTAARPQASHASVQHASVARSSGGGQHAAGGESHGEKH